jgi:hypothetical protein
MLLRRLLLLFFGRTLITASVSSHLQEDDDRPSWSVQSLPNEKRIFLQREKRAKEQMEQDNTKESPAALAVQHKALLAVQKHGLASLSLPSRSHSASTFRDSVSALRRQIKHAQKIRDLKEEFRLLNKEQQLEQNRLQVEVGAPQEEGAAQRTAVELQKIENTMKQLRMHESIVAQRRESKEAGRVSLLGQLQLHKDIVARSRKADLEAAGQAKKLELASESPTQHALNTLQKIHHLMEPDVRVTTSPTQVPPTLAPTSTPTYGDIADDDHLAGDRKGDGTTASVWRDVLRHSFNDSSNPGIGKGGNETTCKQTCCSSIVPMYPSTVVGKVFPETLPADLATDCAAAVQSSVFFQPGGDPCVHVQPGGDLAVLTIRNQLYDMLASFCVCFRGTCDHKPVALFNTTSVPKRSPLPHKLRSPTTGTAPILEMPASWGWNQSAAAKQGHLKAALHRCLLAPRPSWCP